MIHPAPMQTGLAALRQATGPLHDAVEATGAAARIMDARVTRAAYRDFLIRTGAAVVPLEQWLVGAAPGHGLEATIAWGRVAALSSDITALGGAEPEAPGPITLAPSRAAILGVLYVLEGSALGGAMIARHIQKSLGPEALEFTRFHAGNGERAPQRWKRVVALLAELDGDAPAIQAALSAAQTAFGLFLSAYGGGDGEGVRAPDGNAALPPMQAAS